jgi:hypothetical protein
VDCSLGSCPGGYSCQGISTLRSDGTYDRHGMCCPTSSCEGAGQPCGGIAARLCPQGSTCLDDPTDNCNPLKGGVDCAGICTCNPPRCAGILCVRLSCPTWQQYVPTGECCPKCRTCLNGSTPLATVDCSLMRCPGGYSCQGISTLRSDGITYDRHGMCCPSCPIMDCFPPANCRFVNPTFDANGCQSGCGVLTCVDPLNG